MQIIKNFDDKNHIRKAIALFAIPTVFYLSGSLVVYRVLLRTGFDPKWADFRYLHNVFEGIGLFSGNFTQLLWVVAVILALALPFALTKKRFYPTFLAAFTFLILVAYIASYYSAADK